jgi:protein O-mannosyl-transferase
VKTTTLVYHLAQGKKIITQKQIPVKKTVKISTVQPAVGYMSHKYFFPAVIILLCFLLYGNTLFNSYAGDDGIYTYQNDFIVKGFSAFKDIFDKGSLYGVMKDAGNPQYRPLPLLSFMAEVSVFGLNPHVSHFINILLFAFTMVLLYFFLQRILSQKDTAGKNYNQAIVMAATLLFVFHPIHTEVVANIKSRDEILGFLFGLISFYCILLHQDHHKNKYYIFSLLAFFAALFCKENCLTFVAIIPLLLYFFTSLELKNIALRTIPFAGLVSLYLLARHLAIPQMTFSNDIPVIVNTLMAATNTADRTATSFVLLGKYIFMNLVPYPLSDDYSYKQIPVASWGSIEPILSLLAGIALAGIMIWGFKRKSIFSFLIALFFITLLLSSNLVIRIANTFGERFLFVPSLSYCVALPILMVRALRLNPYQQVWKNSTYFYIPVGILLCIYTLIVIPRNAEWKNNYTLSEARVIAAPDCAVGHYYLARDFMDSAQRTKDPELQKKIYAISTHEFKRGIELYNFYPDWGYNLGVCYYAEGLQDSAIWAYKFTLNTHPGYSPAANNLGVIYFNKTQFDTAIKYFTISYKADSSDPNSLMNIGASYQNEKNYTKAFYYDSLVLKKAPNNRLALTNMSVMHNDMGIQFVSNNQLDKALDEFSIALRCDSNSANALGDMGVVYQKRGEIEKAKKCYQMALLKDPRAEVFAKNLQVLNGGVKN